MNNNTVTHRATTTTGFLHKVYAWMCGGLAISGITSYLVMSSPVISNAIFTNDLLFFIIVIIQLVLVIALSGAIRRVSADTAIFLFLLYCLVTGVTLSSIFLIYSTASIATTFFIAAGMFAAISVYGATTKRDLSKMGQMLMMGLFGIIIAMIVNSFVRNSMADFVISILGVIIFTGLTAYDTQKLTAIHNHVQTDEESETKLAIIGALMLYLDFINLFLELLRLMGRKK